MIQVRLKPTVPFYNCFPMKHEHWYAATLILRGVICTEVKVTKFDMVIDKRFLEVRNADEAKSEAVASVATEESQLPLALPIRSDEVSEDRQEHI